MAQLIVEVLDARGAVRARTRLPALPATVGRGYDNDVVLDDPYVCAHHFRLVDDGAGGVVAEDAGSVNGLRRPGSRERAPRLALDARAPELVAGRTLLRVRPADHPVPPALVERAGAGALLARDSAAANLALSLVAVAIFSAFGYSQTYEQASAAKAIGGGVGILLVLAAWSGVWALVSRAALHHFHFLRHLGVAALAALALMTIVETAEWLDYVSPGVGVDAGLLVLGVLAVAIWALSAHLTIASALPRRQRLQWATGLTVGVGALLVGLGMANEDRFTNKLDDPGALKPLGPRWVHAQPVTDFAADEATLRQKVDSLASARD